MWVMLPTFPLAFLITIRGNILENCDSSIETMYLQQCGTQVQIKYLTGRKITHPIESFSKASDEQIIKLFKAGGPAFADKMKDFFPVVVKLTNDMNDLILVDNKG